MSSKPLLWTSYGLRVTCDGPEGRVITDLDKPYARIGSHDRAEIRLAEETVDPRRLFLHATDLGLFFVDLEPFNTVRPFRHGWLEPNEVVGVGAFQISAELLFEGRPVEIRPPEDRASDLCKFGTEGQSRPILEVYFKGQKIKECALRRRLVLVGRRRPCTLLIDDGGLSMCHGAFYWRHKKLWFIDFLSSNGTQRDAQNVDATSVHLGDRLELGNIELHFARISSGHRAELAKQHGEGAERPSCGETVRSAAFLDSRDSSDFMLDTDRSRLATARLSDSGDANAGPETAKHNALETETQILAEACRGLERERSQVEEERASPEKETALVLDDASSIPHPPADVHDSDWIPNLGEEESHVRVDRTATVIDVVTTTPTEAAREIEVPISFLKRATTDSSRDELPTSSRLKLKNPTPKWRAPEDAATKPRVETQSEVRRADPLDESLEYVLNRLVSRERKFQRKITIGRLLAVLVLLSLLIAGAIAVSFWNY